MVTAVVQDVTVRDFNDIRGEYMILVSGVKSGAAMVSSALPDFSMPGIQHRVYPGPGIPDFMAVFSLVVDL